MSKHFGGIAALDDVSFDVRAGEVLGFLGPNGAGKTTLFDVLSGFQIPSQGNIELEGTSIIGFGPDARARLGLGRSFQDGRLFPALTVAETIAVALERSIDVRDPLAAALHLPSVVDSEAKVADASRSSSSCWASARSATSTSASSPLVVGASSTWPACSLTDHECSCSTSRPRGSRSVRPKHSARCSSGSAP